MQYLQITGSAERGCSVLAVVGEIDLSNSARLGAALERGRMRGTPLVADLSRVDFCDVSGLRALLVAHQRCARWGAPLSVVPSSTMARLFDLAFAPNTLTLCPDRSCALDGSSCGDVAGSGETPQAAGSPTR